METGKRVGTELKICPDLAEQERIREELNIEPGSIEDLMCRFRIPYDSRKALLEGLRDN